MIPCATTRAHSRSPIRSYSAVPIYHLFTNGRHLTKSLSCHDFFMSCRSKTTLGQQPNTKQSTIYKTKCNVLNCLLYTRAPDPHVHIQHMYNQHTHIFPPHACRRLWLQNSFIDPDKTKHPCIWHILSASCRRKGFFFSATFMDIPSRKMPSCMAVVAQATR